MYFRFLAVFIIVEVFSQISGVREELKQSICKSYENEGYEKMYNEILKMHDRVLAKKEMDPCVFYTKYLTALKKFNMTNVEIQIELITGDFRDNRGYELIVDELVTIDIPAIIKCTLKLKNLEDRLRYDRESFVYYMVMRRTVDNFDYDKVIPADIISNNNKSLYVLEESAVITHLLQSYKYNIRTLKSSIKTWFHRKKDKPNKIKDICEALNSYGKSRMPSHGKLKKSSLGKSAESCLAKPKKSSVEKPEQPSSGEWKVISGTIEIGPKIFRLTNETEVELIGIIVCNVSFTLNEKTTTEIKYFTMAKYEKEDNDKGFVRMHGPTKIGDKQIFALNSKLLKPVEN